MSSLLIWDSRTNEIVACKIPPSGAPKPTIQNSMPHRPDDWQHMRSEWIAESLTTLRAQQTLRIIDGAPVPKPSVRVSWTPSGPLEGVLAVDVDHLLPGETLDDIRAILQTVGGAPVELELDAGETEMELPFPGVYYVTVTDERVQQPMAPVEVRIE